ncbi:hypothetical protein QLX08_007219 [Tetragonisca angustula]|uniref:Gustatory receptor n=1 Tax=Tetragonisca angustula TaxID=166442 RepID=A0AAW0ZQU0_9HYME
MNNYEDATRIITILNHITALRNFIDPRKNQFKFICSWIWSMTLILIIAVIQFRVEIYINKGRFDIEYFIYILQYATHAFGYTSSMIIGLCQSKNALALVKQIDKVDETLKKLGIKIDYGNLFHHVKIIGFFWLLNVAILYGMFIEWIVQKRPLLYLMSSTFIYIYITNAQSVVLYDYNATIFWLKSRFKMINDLVETSLLENNETKTKESNRKIIRETSNNSQNRLEADEWLLDRSLVVSQVSSADDTSNFKQGLFIDEKARLIQQIRFLHLQVCNVSKMVNHIFNAQILIYTFAMLMYVSITTYFIYMEVRRKANILEMFDLILIFMLDGIVAILKIAVMSYDCECAMRQASKTIGLIHASPLYRESVKLKNEILQFLWQISYTQLESTKSVYYILNYNFVRDCQYLIITYLVIMVQLSQNLLSNKSVTFTNETFQTLQQNVSLIV